MQAASEDTANANNKSADNEFLLSQSKAGRDASLFAERNLSEPLLLQAKEAAEKGLKAQDLLIKNLGEAFVSFLKEKVENEDLDVFDALSAFSLPDFFASNFLFFFDPGLKVSPEAADTLLEGALLEDALFESEALSASDSFMSEAFVEESIGKATKDEPLESPARDIFAGFGAPKLDASLEALRTEALRNLTVLKNSPDVKDAVAYSLSRLALLVDPKKR